MAVLLLNIASPMQSWGTELKLKDHPTQSYPSKSGIIGLIASSEGRKRSDDIRDLARLMVGVRIDRPGVITTDYQTACIRKNVSDTKIDDKYRYVGHRYFLCDAKFTAAISGEKALLEDIAYNLRHPANALFFGRRCFPANADLVVGIFDEDLDESLHSHGFTPGMTIIEDTDRDGDQMVRDVPVSFDFRKRQWEYRMIKVR